MNPSLALKRVETFLDLPAWFQWDFGEFRFRDLSFSSLTEGWLLLEHLLLHTVDGGCTWRFVNAQTPAGMLAKSIVSVEPGSCWIVLRQIEDSRPKAIPIAKCSADGGKLEAIWIGYTDGWFHLGSRLFFNGPSQGWLTANEHIDGRDQGALFSIGQDGQPWERLWDYRLRTEQTRFRNATCGVQLARNFEQDPTRAYRVVYNGESVSIEECKFPADSSGRV